MKAYTFVHSYICGIQVGIQAGHSNVELMRKEEGDSDVREWADHHKTFVWLDGGDSEKLNDVINIMQESGMPYAYFNEPALKCSSADEDDAGLVTAATVLLSTEMVEAADYIRRFRLLLNGTGFHNPDGSFNPVGNDFGNGEKMLIWLIANSRSKSL
ncbi:hydrolase [Vibrio phage D148]